VTASSFAYATPSVAPFSVSQSVIPVAAVLGPSVSARPSAIAWYSSAVSSTSWSMRLSTAEIGGRVHPGRRTMRDPAADRGTDRVDELDERRSIRSDRVDDLVVRMRGHVETTAARDRRRGSAGCGSHRVHHAEHGEVPKQPRDVVHEHTVVHRTESRPQDRVRHPGFGECRARRAPCRGSTDRATRSPGG